MSATATAATARELGRQICARSLLSEHDVDAAIQSLAAGADAPAELLIEKLVGAGRLTAFQAKALREGRDQDLVVGNYEILSQLGVGGMGTVYKARHRKMKRIVALKIMSRSLCKDQRSVLRFQQEVETIARLSHPHIVSAYDADEAEAGHFLVMEFVDGRDLASVVQQSGPLSIRDAISCIVQSAQGLEYAHSQSILHRDIKPANLLRDQMGMVKITDLGLARLNESEQGAVDTGLTQAGTVMGTPDYMSPEQAIDSGAVDHRADIYSLGCTLFFLLTGKTPFSGKTVMATLLNHRDQPIPKLSASRLDIPAELEAAYEKMMAKNVAERFQHMADVAAALLAVPLPERESAIESTDFSLGAGDGDSPSTRVQSMPNNNQTAEFTPVPEPQPKHDVKPPIALLVESSRVQASIMRKYLDSLGFETLMAATLAEAITQARSRKPDVVLSAMFLKDGTGVEVGQRMNAAFPFQTIGFVLVSSQEESKSITSLSQCGPATLLHKPFTIEKLAATLSEVLKRPIHVSPSKSMAAQPVSTGMTAEFKRPALDRAAIRVLIVDDSAIARTNVKRVLQSLGVNQFTEAMDGAQAVAAVAQKPFDLVVTDYNMPMMDGAALIAYLRQNTSTATIPVVMVTTETDEHKLAAVRQFGVAAIVPKSFPVATIRQVLEQIFG